MEKRTVGERGQIVLPKHLREEFGLKPGKKVVFEVKGRSIFIKPEKDPKKFVEEFVSVPRKLKKKIDIKKLMEKQIDEEYDLR